MTYISYQGNDHDCGFAGLRMLLANVSKNKSYLYISKPQKKKNYTYYDLIRYARRYGFRLVAYKLLDNEYMKIPDQSLVLLKTNHMVYINKIHKRHVTIYDPAYGKERLSIKEFLSLWDGTLLTCVNKDYALDIDYKKPRFVPVWMDIVHYVIVGLVFGSLLAGFYLVKDDSNIFITMLFLALFGIAELVENWYIIKELNFFDKVYIPKFFAQKKNHNYRNYSFYIDYKTKHFALSKTLLSNLIIISAFSVLLCVNDYRNLFMFIVIVLLKTMDNKLFSKNEKEDEQQISNIETVAFDVDKMVVRNLSKANQLAGRLSLIYSVKKVLYMLVCLCLSLLMMSVSGVASSNFVIFHFGIYFISSESIECIINFFSNSKSRKQKEARFLDICDL